MSNYRIYLLDDEDRINVELEERFSSDAAALICGRIAAVGQYAAEVWKGERLLARMGGALRLNFAT